MVRPKSFDELAELLSDRRVVDWNEAEREADVSERNLIRNLRLIDDIGRVARADDPSTLLPADFTIEAPALSAHPRTMSDRAKPVAGEETGSWGPLQLLEKVGSGSFGDVFRAWDPVLNRQVALKLMNTRAAELPDAGARVLDEARLLARVEHPNVARIYGVEEHGGQLGIWMEFVEGTDLASVLLERGRLDAVEAARLGSELCGALAAVHASNVVHKDVKAQNVMLRRDGRLVLMDFGAGRKRKLREGEGEVVVTGTPRYMAPETLRREPATPQSDLYSVGVLLYNLVTGDFPVSGTVPEIIKAHEEGQRVPLRERHPDLPESFVRIVERAMAPARADRPGSAAELEVELRDFVRTHAQPAQERSGRSAPRRTPSARTFRGVLAVAAVLAAIIVGYGLTREPGELKAEVRFTGNDQMQFTQFDKDDEIGSDTQLEVKIKLNRPAYVYVLNRDADGSTVLLYPMANSGPHEKLAAGAEHTIPGEIGGERIRWTMSDTEGAERFLVLASLEPLPEFERVLENVAQLDASELGTRQIDQLALNAIGDDVVGNELTRGVTGLARARDDDMDVFAVAEMMASDGQARPDGTVFLYHLRLQNVGR